MMTNSRSPLVAFRVAELQESINQSGHYDADQQVWVGDEIGSRNVVTSVSTNYVETTPLTNPDVNFDIEYD